MRLALVPLVDGVLLIATVVVAVRFWRETHDPVITGAAVLIGAIVAWAVTGAMSFAFVASSRPRR